MEFLAEPIEYNDDGSVNHIKTDIWVKDYRHNYVIVIVIPKLQGWAYTEDPSDVPMPFETVTYKLNGHSFNDWTLYTKI